MNNFTLRSICFFTFALLFTFVANAQTLTVRQIMAEPSIAGQRVEGEKISPDGRFVIYLWNAEGKPRRDLYLVPTSGGEPEIILRTSDLPPLPKRPEKENKLDYGVELRDDFVKSREGGLGGFEWSPDSKKLVFTYGGDLYVLDLRQRSPEYILKQRNKRWSEYEEQLLRQTDLVPNLIVAIKSAGVQEDETFSRVENSRTALLTKLEEKPAGSNGIRSEYQRHEIITAAANLSAVLEIVSRLPQNYPILEDTESFSVISDELQGVQNRSNVYLMDHKLVELEDNPKRYTKTEAGEFGADFIDNDRIMYRSGGDIFILNTADSTTTQLTKEADAAKSISVGNAAVTKDGKLAAYVVSDSSKYRSLVVPNYLGEYVTAGTRRRGWSDQKLFVTLTDGSRDTPFEIELPKQQGVGGFRRIAWAADNRSLIVDRGDMDTKRRQLFYIRNAGAKDQQIALVTEETDPKWLAPLSYIVEPNPKNADQLFFASERDGFNHLYLATLHSAQVEPKADEPIDANGDAKVTGVEPPLSVKVEQLTKGDWQVEWAKWDPNVSQIIYMSTEKGPSERTFSVITDIGKKVAPFNDVANTRSLGMINSPQLAADPSDDLIPQLIYESSKWNEPGELYAFKLCLNCSATENATYPIQLTKTVPAAFSAMKWNEPKFISIPSRDGKTIPAKIYLPAGHNAKTKYPMVVFVHGAGYLQNVINGWNNYYREFMFNELLTKKGYVVLDIDYRGSAGYGRDWRTDVYDFLGGKDMDDHVDAIDYMVANYNVNKDKVGVYGGSYGGFMAGMLAMRAPDKVAAAAALRPVFDWKNYYASSPGYTAQRLGFPDKNPEAYKRSSPITYADKLERPLLILHGMSDDNVPVQDSVQLIEKLIRLGKTEYFEAMLYPSENHGFVRPESWTDEYERILAFFEKHLK